MKKLSYLIVLVVILSLVLTGCLLSNVGQVPTSEQSGITYLTKGGPSEIPLYAGQDIPVGTVTVSNDDTNLYVTYETTGGWVMTETHLAVVTDTNDFPTNKAGNPKVGKFPYGEENIFTDTWEEIIELSAIPAGVGQTLYIAAQAVVEEVTCFDGTSGLTIEGTGDLNINGSITVEALVKVEFSETDKFYTIVGKWNDRDGNDRAWLLGIYNLRPCFYISTNGTNFPRAIVDLGNELNIGQWYHLKGTFDATNGEIKIYVNDILENTNDTIFGNININEEPVLIGGDRAGGGNGRFFNGCIDEVNVWGGIGESATLVLEWPETPVTESAWGDGVRFVQKGNWATYFTYTVGVLEVTQDSGQNDENRGLSRPHINWEIDGLCIEFEFVNPTAYYFVFDYRVDEEEGESHAYSDIVITGGELLGELIGLRYNWVVVAPGETEEVQVCAEEEVWVGMRVGAEHDWYLNWIIFEAKY